MNRADEKYPTRQFPYRKMRPGDRPHTAIESAEATPQPQLNGGIVYRFILGQDTRLREMSAQEMQANLGDVFGKQLLQTGVFPLSLNIP